MPLPTNLTEAEKQILDAYIRAFIDTRVTPGRIFGEGEEQRIMEEAIDWASRRAADTIAGVDATTQDRIMNLVGESVQEGWTEDELVNRIIDLGVDPTRAETIARTETALAYNVGEAERWEDDGVEYVWISDGHGDDFCLMADGEIWRLRDYQTNPLSHPNCKRSATPIGEAELHRLKRSGEFKENLGAPDEDEDPFF